MVGFRKTRFLFDCAYRTKMNKTASFFQHSIFQEEECRISGGTVVFSRHGIPLLLLPRDKAVALRTIRLYLPQTRIGKVSVLLLRLLVHLRLLWLLPRVPIASSTSDAGLTSGYLVCNPVHGVRLIRVIKTEDGFVIEKIAERANASPIESEYRLLQRLSNRAYVPLAYDWKETDSLVAFRMASYGRAPACLNIGSILHAWETCEEVCAEDSSFFQKLRPYFPDGFWQQFSKKRFRKALIHGDFVPWNIRTTASNDLMCVDWEYAEEDGIAGFDFAYFILQQAICVFRCPQEKLATVLKEVLQPNSTLLRQYHVTEGGGVEFNAYGWTFEEAVQLVLAYRGFRGME